jgi:hypothetical protein
MAAGTQLMVVLVAAVCLHVRHEGKPVVWLAAWIASCSRGKWLFQNCGITITQSELTKLHHIEDLNLIMCILATPQLSLHVYPA